jgi:hypothetical protein
LFRKSTGIWSLNNPKRNPFAVITDILKPQISFTGVGVINGYYARAFSIIQYIAPTLVGSLQPRRLLEIYLIGGALTIFSAPIVGKLADEGNIRFRNVCVTIHDSIWLIAI